MHPYRGIVRTYIRSYGLSMISDNPNTLTVQSSGTNNTPRDLLHGTVTNPYIPPFQDHIGQGFKNE